MILSYWAFLADRKINKLRVFSKPGCSESSASIIAKALKPTYYSTGESIVRLRNIEGSEPEPALFRAGSDYQIVDDEHDHAETKIP